MSRDFSYKGKGDSAEWIEEAPTIGGKQARLSNFGHVEFTSLSYYTKGESGLNWYSTAMGSGSKIDMRQDGTVVAVPSLPLPAAGGQYGQHFTDTYK